MSPETNTSATRKRRASSSGKRGVATHEDRKLMAQNLEHTPRVLGFGNWIGFLVAGPGSTTSILVLILLMVSMWPGLGVVDCVLDWTAFPMTQQEVQGKVTSKTATGWSINEREQYVFEFEFTVDGETWDSWSYSCRSSAKTGSSVTVQYLPARVTVARIKGMSYSQLPGVVVLIGLIILSLCCIFAIRGYVKGCRWVRLMQRGEAIWLTLKSKKATNTSINDQRVYILTFEYEDSTGRPQTHVVKNYKNPELGGQRKTHLALCDSAVPSRCCLVTQLPLNVTLSTPGQWDSPTGKTWRTIIVRLVILVALLTTLGFLWK